MAAWPRPVELVVLLGEEQRRVRADSQWPSRLRGGNPLTQPVAAVIVHWRRGVVVLFPITRRPRSGRAPGPDPVSTPASSGWLWIWLKVSKVLLW